MGRRAGEVSATISAGRQHNHMCAEAVDCAVIQVPGHDATANAFLIHDEVYCKILDKKFRLVLQALLIQRMQDRVTCTVSGSARSPCCTLAHMRCHAAKG